MDIFYKFDNKHYFEIKLIVLHEYAYNSTLRWRKLR